MNGAKGRLLRLERRAAPAELRRVVIVNPALWPELVRRRYEAASAAGNRETVADVVEAQTGQRPATGGQTIAIVEVYGVDPDDI